jgi:outer membrane putative beta-barrel porin/alpha-amylase
MTIPWIRLAAVWASWVASAAAAQPSESEHVAPADAAADGSGSYNLLHPTPRERMREMATDRPDITESPISVDAGHFQVEMDAVSVARDDGVTDLALGALNVKLGLTTFSDLQLVVEPYHHVGSESGFGDLTLRNKYNLWGNDAGPTAFGLMPFVTLPTASEGFGADHVEGGLIVPFGLEGPLGWELGTMAELDAVWREDAYAGELLLTGTVGHDIWKELGGFVEVVSTVPLDGEAAELGANSGLTLGLSDDVIIDAGVRVGLNAAAEDFSSFLGGSARY